MANQNDVIESEMARERKVCRCNERMIIDENGMKVCGPACAGCRHYDANPIKCDIRDDIITALEEEEAYNDTVGFDRE